MICRNVSMAWATSPARCKSIQASYCSRAVGGVNTGIELGYYAPILKRFPTLSTGIFLGGGSAEVRGGMSRGRGPQIRLFCPAEISVIDIIPEPP
jgi:hypothetical protein